MSTLAISEGCHCYVIILKSPKRDRGANGSLLGRLPSVAKYRVFLAGVAAHHRRGSRATDFMSLYVGSQLTLQIEVTTSDEVAIFQLI